MWSSFMWSLDAEQVLGGGGGTSGGPWVYGVPPRWAGGPRTFSLTTFTSNPL